MKSSPTRRVLVAGAGIVALAVPLAACSGGGSADGKTEITFLTTNTAPTSRSPRR